MAAGLRRELFFSRQVLLYVTVLKYFYHCAFQLGYFLYEYIKKRQLWDEEQPTVIHCDKDPLGHVFGVPKFTRAEAGTLLLKNVFPVNLRKRRHQEIATEKVGVRFC